MAGRSWRRDVVRRGESGAVLTKAAIVALVVVLAVAVAGFAGVIPGLDDDKPSDARGTVQPLPTGPGLNLTTPPSPPAVLAAASTQPPVSLLKLRKHIASALALPGLGGHVGFAVSQLGNPAVSWHQGAVAVTPASTMKLLTSTAALATLGPNHRFTTSVVQAKGGAVVLVGGGDPLLVAETPTADEAADLYPQPASLQQLAISTAAELTAHGVRRVRLGFDSSLFSGPAVNPRWPATYIPENVVSPISALWVNEGRAQAGLAQRSVDPAQAAAEEFRAQLIKAGIKVVGQPTLSQAPAASQPVLAEVESAPLAEIVQHILEVSDNEGAEVLLRQVAVAAGRPGSAVAGVAAVRAALAGLGLDVRGAVFYDGSGLSRLDLVPVQLLLHVIETAAAPSRPALHGVLTGLPVAGFSGSLGYRFADEEAADGRGYVRAKTGTLTGVQGLAGIAITRQGQVLAFVAVADRVPVSKSLDARADLDAIGTALSTCTC